MSNEVKMVQMEYRAAKETLNTIESNRIRAEARNDFAIVRAYDKLIVEQKLLVAKIERRLFKAMADELK